MIAATPQENMLRELCQPNQQQYQKMSSTQKATDFNFFLPNKKTHHQIVSIVPSNSYQFQCLLQNLAFQQ